MFAVNIYLLIPNKKKKLIQPFLFVICHKKKEIICLII